MNPTEVESQATSSHMNKVVEAYKRYQKALNEANALDFDDLLLKTVRLFTDCPDVLDRYQETWRYLHVDEYQDTNHVQYLLISLLAKKYRNLYVIDDPDQSIYAFRVADTVSYTHHRAHETTAYFIFRLLLEKKNTTKDKI